MSPRLPSALRRALRRFIREDGIATLEFVVMLPVFLMIFMASFESGLLMTRFVMLERAVDLTVRELRLGIFVNPKHDVMKKVICDRTVFFQDCEDIMRLDLTPVAMNGGGNWLLPAADAPCVDRDAVIKPLISDLNTGTSNEMMLVRACAVFDPIWPLTGIGLNLNKDASGGYSLVAASAFVNEPS